MGDRRKHRGKNPQDLQLFSSKTIPVIREAVSDLSFLLTKGYSMSSASKLVGDRYLLNERQRIAIARSSCSDHSRDVRKSKEVEAGFCKGGKLFIDGYNLLITIESALSGGFIFKGRDQCYRDLSSIHGSYKKVEETIPSINLIAKEINELQPSKVMWYLDAPISNSGRLKVILKEMAERNNWPWEVELSNNPDHLLKNCNEIVITTDSMILNEVKYWLNLTPIIIANNIPQAQVIDL